MMVGERDRFVFVSTPKCGTNTLYAVLREHFDVVSIPPLWHNNRVPDRYRDFLVWTVTRNPYARAVSLWRSTIWGNQRDVFRRPCGSDGFADFLRWRATEPPELVERQLHWSQSAWLADVHLGAALRLERLDEELRTLPFWRLGIPIPYLNATRPRGSEAWRSYIDDEVRALILDWARSDFDRFGYSLELEVAA